MKKLILICLLFCGCENMMTRSFGGTQTIELKPGQKLVNITWKEDTIWYLTQERSSDESAKTSHFVSKSSMGIFEGEVIVVEK